MIHCPKCKGTNVLRERRPLGDTRCASCHFVCSSLEWDLLLARDPENRMRYRAQCFWCGHVQYYNVKPLNCEKCFRPHMKQLESLKEVEVKPRFWIEISSNGMPIAVEKCSFMPTIYHAAGSRWHDFGELGEIEEMEAEIKDLRNTIRRLHKFEEYALEMIHNAKLWIRRIEEME